MRVSRLPFCPRCPSRPIRRVHPAQAMSSAISCLGSPIRSASIAPPERLFRAQVSEGSSTAGRRTLLSHRVASRSAAPSRTFVATLEQGCSTKALWVSTRQAGFARTPLLLQAPPAMSVAGSGRKLATEGWPQEPKPLRKSPVLVKKTLRCLVGNCVFPFAAHCRYFKVRRWVYALAKSRAPL